MVRIYLRPVSASLSCIALVAACLMVLPVSVAAQDDDTNDKPLDVRSSLGNLHIGNDADPREVGLPVYPGARIKRDDKDKNSADLSILTTGFGIKLVVINYVSDDSPDKILAFYREKLKKYGKIVECHSSGNDGPHVQVHENDKELRCEGDNKGDNVELKAGTQDNQHAVAVEPNKSGTGSTFALVYVHTRGKQADI